MGARERDPFSGYRTTGHEWDGIKELETPIPIWWLTVFIGSCFVALAYLWLYPSFATTGDYFKGALGWTSKGQLLEDLAAGKAAQTQWLSALAAKPLARIEEDEELRRFATAGGRAAFQEVCAPCHGVGAGGQIGQFPALIDDDWLWGGRIEDIHQTIRFGIRSGHEEARDSAMPAFGEFLTPAEIGQVADYVLTLSDPDAAGQRDAMAGAAIFAQNCASCHGEKGEGGRDFGAPRLNDAIWLYGSSRQAVMRQITNPRMGVMPAFSERLDPETIRMLAVYVHTLGGGER